MDCATAGSGVGGVVGTGAVGVTTGATGVAVSASMGTAGAGGVGPDFALAATAAPVAIAYSGSTSLATTGPYRCSSSSRIIGIRDEPPTRTIVASLPAIPAFDSADSSEAIESSIFGRIMFSNSGRVRVRVRSTPGRRTGMITSRSDERSSFASEQDRLRWSIDVAS